MKTRLRLIALLILTPLAVCSCALTPPDGSTVTLTYKDASLTVSGKPAK